MSLVKTINEVTPWLKIASDIKADNLPDFNEAEQTYLVPILGEDLYSELTAAYEANTLSTNQAVLLRYCQAVIVPMGFALDLPMRQVILSGTGLTVTETSESRKAFKWEYKNMMEAIVSKGYAAQETLILFLRSHRADFPQWENSPYNDPGRCALIRDGADLKTVISLQQPHRCFMFLQPILETIIDVWMIPALSEAYYTVLNNKLATGTALSTQEQYITDRLRKALARKVMEQAAAEASIRFAPGLGFTIVDKLVDQPEEGHAGASNAQMLRFIEDHKAASTILMEQVIGYMNKNASNSVFAEYYTSDAYSDPDSNPGKIDNSQFTGVFGT